eukprot:3115965-Pleurochrysis_carterae.AAC.3
MSCVRRDTTPVLPVKLHTSAYTVRCERYPSSWLFIESTAQDNLCMLRRYCAASGGCLWRRPGIGWAEGRNVNLLSHRLHLLDAHGWVLLEPFLAMSCEFFGVESTFPAHAACRGDRN